MKILRIRLKNLNSLKGEHQVDLSAEPLASAGLFAITGSTGAGKSTLLDAVTLALYGKAARYGNDANPEHIMSRHCGECSAEVEFEVPSGIYRAVWERHKSRKRADGALQPPKRYIYDMAGVALAQSIKDAESKIEQLLGLNYDRFLRSVLLAQGDFARFLKAGANERAELLESLTGTEIYSRLSQLAFAEANRRENELRLKESGLEQIIVLEEGERRELELVIQRVEEERKELVKNLEAGSAMLAKIANLEQARGREEAGGAEKKKIETEALAARSDLDRLRRHRLTLAFADGLARLDAAESIAQAAKLQKEKAEDKSRRAREAGARAGLFLRGSFDAALLNQRKNLREATETLQKESKAALEARAWIEEHRQDAILVAHWGDLVAAITELKTVRVAFESKWSEWSIRASKVLPEDFKLPLNLLGPSADPQKLFVSCFSGIEEKKERIQAEGEEAKKQQELREDHLAKTKLLASLTDHRRSLKSGEPCPLCGALEHPYAEDLPADTELAGLELEVKKARDKLLALRDVYKNLATTAEGLKSDEEKIFKLLLDFAAREKSLADLLRPLSLALPESGEEDRFRAGLQDRERLYRSRVQSEEQSKLRQLEAERMAKAAREEVAALDEKIANLGESSAEAEGMDLPRGGIKSVPEAEVDYAASLQEEKISAAQAKDRVGDAKIALEKHAEAEATLRTLLRGSEFQSVGELRQARMTAAEADQTEKIEDQLKSRSSETETLLKQARAQINQWLEEKVLEGGEAHAFRVQQSQLKLESDQVLVEQAGQQNRIKADDQNRRQRSQKEKELGEDRASLVVWKQLRELMGSHDGSKFRRYAQSISLDILTRHANRHLAKLSDRYRICRDDGEALNLQIEDLHQADVRRPMASLSGGESFLASLALALGLSDLAGRTVRIDSLFIDEGFGSLDPETLDIAIDALESLRQDHKTVGVISHVGLLKERIGTQIIVEKKAGGVSQIRVVPQVPSGTAV